MASNFWSILKVVIAAIPKAVADYKANTPPPAGQSLTGAQAAAAAVKIQAWLTRAIPLLQDHPGAITAADDILAVFGAQGDSWASDVQMAIDGAPGALVAFEKVLPEIIWALGAFEPAATGIQGDGHSTMWQS